MREALLAFVVWSLEAGWVFLCDVEVAFEGEACTGYGAFIEEAADEGDAVGYSAGWAEEFTQRPCRACSTLTTQPYGAF